MARSQRLDFVAKRPRDLSRRALLGGAVAGAAGIAVSGARAAAADDPAVLRVAVPTDVDNLDPAFAVGTVTAQTVIQNCFDQLTQYRVVTRTAPDGEPYLTVDTADIIPMLCESREARGADLIFTLPDGLTFANGNPIDASTFVTGFRRIFELQGIISFLLSMGGAVEDASAFEAVDAHTFAIHMSRPNALIPQNLVMNSTSVLDPAEIAAHTTADDPWATRYFKDNVGSGTGPYQLASHIAGDTITLVRNERYRGPRPEFATVALKIVPDSTQRVSLLRNGDVDLALEVPLRHLDVLAESEGVRVRSLPSTRVAFVMLNATSPPFDRKEVRQAIAYALPYDDIITSVYRGRAQSPGSLVPAGMPTSDPAANPYRTDLDRTRALLAEAGYPGGAGISEVTLSVIAEDEEGLTTAIIVEDALRQLGIEATVRTVPAASFDVEQAAGTFQAAVGSWFSNVNDPFYHLFWLTWSGSQANFPRLSNERVDRIIEEFLLAEATPERDQASREAQAIVAGEANYIVLCQPDVSICTRSDVGGYVRYNDELPRFALMSRTAE